MGLRPEPRALASRASHAATSPRRRLAPSLLTIHSSGLPIHSLISRPIPPDALPAAESVCVRSARRSG